MIKRCYIPRLRTRSNFSLRMAMKCFISGKYSVILPWPLPIDADKGLRWWCPHLGFLLASMWEPQSLWRRFTASKGFNLASGSFFKATLSCWRTRLWFEILVGLQGRLDVDFRRDGKDLQSEVVELQRSLWGQSNSEEPEIELDNIWLQKTWTFC